MSGPWEQYAGAAEAPPANGPWSAYKAEPPPPKGVEVPEQIPQAMEDRLIAGSEARKREGGLLQTIPAGLEMISTPEGRTKLWEAVKKYPSKFIDDTINMAKLPGDVQSGKIDLTTEDGLDQAIGLGMLVAGSRLNKLSATGQTSGLGVAMGESVSRISKGPMGEIYDLPIGTVARSEDFVTAAQIVAGEDAPMVVQDKLLRVYITKGMHPSELAHDAQTDPIVAQRLLSSDPEPAKLLPHYLRAGPSTIETTPVSGKTLYHETSAENAAIMLTEDLTNDVSKIRTANVFMADNPDIAIGQGGSGVRIEFDGDLVSAREHKKPGTGDLTGREYLANGIGNNAIKSITVPAGEELSLKPSWRARFDATFDKTTLADGSVRYDRKPSEAGGLPPGGPPKPPKPPAEPPPEGSFEAAQKTILDKISVDEAPTKEGWSWAKFYRKAIDDLHPLKAVDEGAYELARLTRGQFGKAEHFIEHGTFDFETYATNGKPLAKILEPVSQDLDGFRAYLASKRALEIEASGRKSGMDVEAATRVAAEGEGTYGKAAAEIVGYQNNLLKYLKDSGVLSDAAYDAMVEAGKNYIPFYRVIGETESGGKGGTSFGPGTPLKRLKGSERDVIDPLESVIKNTYAYVSIAERNAVGIKLIDALKKAGAEATTSAERVQSAAVKVNDKIYTGANHLEALEKAAAELGTDVDKIHTKVNDAKHTQYDAWVTSTGRFIDSKEAAKIVKSPHEKLDSLDAEFTSQKAARTRDPALEAYLKEHGVSNPEAIVDFIKSAIPEDGDTLGAFRNGVKETVKVNDPELVTAFRGLDQTSADMLVKVLAAPAKLLRAGATLSPDFIVRNIVRDFMTAFVNSGSALFSPIDTAKGLVGVIRKDADFLDWMKGGGANATMVALDRRYMQESLHKLNGETGLMERGWNVVTSPIRGLRMMSELAENATRLGEFKKLTGESKAEIQSAAFGSREVTLDFARIGANMRAYNMITAFGNAQIQGLDRIGRAFVDRPVNTIAKIAGGITLPSVLLWFANKDDPRYKELPQWQKDMAWIILTKDHIYRIPKPFELGVVFGSGVERILDATIGGNPEAFDKFAKSVMDVIMPNYIPTAIQPLYEQWANRSSFSDRTLIPSNMEKWLPEYQYTPYTTELSKKLGQVISAFPGMRSTAVGPGAPFGPIARATTSPILMENYIRSWTGGLGMYALQAADAALRKAGALPDPVTPTPTLADIPVVKAFMVRYPSATTQSIQDFYDQHEVTKKFYDTWLAKAKEGDVDAMSRIQAAGGPMMFVRLDAIKETLTDHNKLVRDIYKNPTIKAEEKRQLIDSLYFNMIEIGKAGKGMLKESERALKNATEAAP
jgi:hypothetical protein